MTTETKSEQQLVWGLPIRLFHWSLVILISVSFYTGEFGDFDSIDIHMWSGYGLLALLLFRIGFGFFARGNARFSEFVRGPKAVRAYLNDPTDTVGHNPLGALGIIALMLSLGVQVTTGLFTTDDIFVEGPLYHLVSSDVSGQLSAIHALNKWILGALIAMHLLAVLVHEWRLGHRLLVPMVTGKKALPAGTRVDRHQFGLAIICFTLSGLAVYYLVNEL